MLYFPYFCRVAYRENELRKRQDEKRLMQQRMSEEQEEKERRLEKLREQVGNKSYIEKGTLSPPNKYRKRHAFTSLQLLNIKFD